MYVNKNLMINDNYRPLRMNFHSLLAGFRQTRRKIAGYGRKAYPEEKHPLLSADRKQILFDVPSPNQPKPRSLHRCKIPPVKCKLLR